MKADDEDLVIAAVDLARHILTEYLEPGDLSAFGTLDRLLLALSSDAVTTALERIGEKKDSLVGK